MRIPSSVYNDHPSFPLLQAIISYQGTTTAPGNVLGTTLIDVFCSTVGMQPSYVGHIIKGLYGGAAGQVRTITIHDLATGTITVDAPFTNQTGAVQQIAANTGFVILSTGNLAIILAILGQLGRPEMPYYEGWQDELGIDFTLWNVTHPAGAPWTRGAGAGVMANGLRATCILNANDIARLVTTFRDPIGPDTWGINSVLRLTHFEFEMTLANLANLDNTQCFFGLTPNQADARAAFNIIGFALIGAGNALQTVTDVGGVETVNTGFLENLANKNKFRITIRQTALGVGTIDFYLNEALIATHITNLPDLPMYKNWYLDTNAGGAATPQIGINRLWTEDFQRP